MGPNRGRRSGEQIADQAAHGGAGADFLRCELLSRAKGVIGLRVFAHWLNACAVSTKNDAFRSVAVS